MHNPYQAPLASVQDTSENNSGGGSSIEVPEGVKGWSWGAFFLGWVWAIGNKTWIGLLCLLPYVGLVMSIYLGVKGREMAWRNKRWDSLEHFNRVQRLWSMWGVGLVLVGIVAGVLIGVMGH